MESDIERTYGGAKKPLASRVPLSWNEDSQGTTSSAASVSGPTFTIPEDIEETATPGVTEGMLCEFWDYLADWL